ncbi:MAG: NADH-quinone oxidoreductase subunit NuoF [Anaerolineae bacterium]|nr:NADH-quinone oxidoreductase subunit NuoF [Anaerolineae bacterium]
MASSEVTRLAIRREQARQQWQERLSADLYITVGVGTCGYAAGAAETLRAIGEELQRRSLTANVKAVGCVGMCSYEPMIELQAKGRPRLNYGHATAKTIPEIFAAYLGGASSEDVLSEGGVIVGQVEETVTRTNLWALHTLGFVDPEAGEAIPFHQKQQRIVLSNCGLVDPESIDDYLALDGYVALVGALTEMTPEAVIQEVLDSGLRGRGGAGFPVGRKWKFARATQSWPKYVLCNADEGDPGAFMDRSVLEGDPHAVIEGMIIAAYAIGARHGYIYCRAEYPLAIRRLQIAVAQARDLGLLGEDILSSGFAFDITIKEGAGAFVCGEETALMASIEGERGNPRPRPPYPAVAGLWDQPSNVNNVKSYAYVSRILRLGAAWFRGRGTQKSPGTAIFALTGKVNRTGLVEVPMGTTLREIVYDLGGGIPDGKAFKAVQTGGPLGGCLPEAYLDTPVDFDSLREAGSVMGSGGMVVCDETTCMVELAKYFTRFVCDESCGKCPPCRLGSIRMLEVLERITEGKGRLEDLDEIRRLATGMRQGSLCALGQLAADPVMSTLRHFEDEYRAHIEERRCPAGQCRELLTYAIDPDKCIGCTLCARNCPVDAITGERGQVHVIDPAVCIRCGMCYTVCKFDAVVVR